MKYIIGYIIGFALVFTPLMTTPLNLGYLGLAVALGAIVLIYTSVSLLRAFEV